MLKPNYQPFKIKSEVVGELCEKTYIEKLFEIESMMIFAVEEVFLESVASHFYGYLCVVYDYIQNIRIMSQNLLNLEIKSPESSKNKSRCFYLNTQVDTSTLAYALLDNLFKTESLANIGNKYIFLENLDGDKTNFLSAVGDLLSQLRELFERWLLFNPFLHTPFLGNIDVMAESI